MEEKKHPQSLFYVLVLHFCRALLTLSPFGSSPFGDQSSPFGNMSSPNGLHSPKLPNRAHLECGVSTCKPNALPNVMISPGMAPKVVLCWNSFVFLMICCIIECAWSSNRAHLENQSSPFGKPIEPIWKGSPNGLHSGIQMGSFVKSWV